MEKTSKRNLWSIYEKEVPEFIIEGASNDAMRRLRHIDMYCGLIYTNFSLYRSVPYVSRLSHSIGTALIAYHFTHLKPVGIASLYHDIATPVFSHSVDFMYHDYRNQEYTESETKAVISRSSEIASFLKKESVSLSEVDDYHIYPIADNESPKLSADRLEYTLSAIYHFHFAEYEEIQQIYDDLYVGRNEEGEAELMFHSRAQCARFAELSLKCSDIYVSDEDRYAMERLAMILREALERKILTRNDLWTDEDRVIRKLKDSELRSEWAAFRQIGKIIISAQPAREGKWLKIDAKKRWINPLCEEGLRSASFDGSFSDAKDDFLERSFDYYICAVDGGQG